MGSFLLKEKKTLVWRGLKGSALFGLGFCTHNALTLYTNELSNEAQQYLAQVKSVEKKYRARLDEVKEIRKKLDYVLEFYKARVAELEEPKKEEFEKTEPVETCCESHEESVWSFI